MSKHQGLGGGKYSTEYMCTLKIRFNLTSFNFVIAEVIRSFKDESWFWTGRLPTRCDRWVSVHGGWLCFGDRCMSLDVQTKVNMVQGQQDSPLSMSHMLLMCCHITPSTSPHVYFCSQFSPFVYGIRSRFSHWVWAKRNVVFVCRVCVAYDTWSR